MEGSCEGLGEYSHAQKESLEEFLFERYYLFVTNKNEILKGFIHHDPLRLKRAVPRIIKNNFLKAYLLGKNNVLNPEFCHVLEGVQVKAWELKELG